MVRAFVIVVLVIAVGLGMAIALVLRSTRRLIARRDRDIQEISALLDTAERELLRLSEKAIRAEDLERFEVERSALLRSVSHDLRTPLSAIRAVATDLLDGVTYDDATRTQLLQTVCDEVDRLDRLVANLLSMSRIEAGAFEPDRQAVDLVELVADRLKRLAPILQNVVVKTGLPDDLPLVRGDYAQLEQVFTNLIANAARYAPAGSDLWIVARDRADASGEPMMQVEVTDHGPGVDPEDRERIFEPFQSGTGNASSGIGLAICRVIVEAHEGSIWVDRSFGGGATFSFTLPIYPLTVDA